MSSRQLRKLQQQKELEEAARRAEEEAAEEESEEEEEAAPRTPPKSKASLFANLAALEEEKDDEDKDESDEAVSEPEAAPKPAAKPKKPKKKKKAKNKGKKKPVDNKDNTDDIDAALKELSLQDPDPKSWHTSKPTFDPQYEKICELVRIQTQHLKVANEMRNLFGKAALENHDEAGGPVPRGGRRPGAQQQVDLETALKGHHPPGKGIPEVTLRRNPFIQGKDDWPKGTTGGLTMEMVDDLRHHDGTMEFRFVHDKTYQAVQQVFQAGVEMGDPQQLIVILVQNPYHISSLIQVSKIAKDQTDHALSHDLLERALFNFGRASLSMFNTKLAEGKARLDFSRPENRELWLAGYQYIKSLVMKGTYRTAFEWAKLLLSLDPDEDPYCMRLLLHLLALRSQQYAWLLELGDFALGQEALPEEERKVQKTCFSSYHNTPSLALAALGLKDGVKARDLLTRSMKRYPWLFVRLFQEINLEAPKSIWGSQPRTDAENLFTSLYVQQTKDLWNTTAGTALLMEIAHTIPKVNDTSIPPVPNHEMDLDVVRFIYLENTPALMAFLPSRLLHRSNNSDSDPIPPDHSVRSYDVQHNIHDHAHRDPRMGPGIGPDGPMAAIAQMLFHRANADDGSDDEEFANMLRNGIPGGFAPRDPLDIADSEDDDDYDPVAGAPPGIARRLLNYLWGRGAYVASETEEEDDGDGEEDTDSDEDEMPDLAPFDQLDNRSRHAEDADDSDTDDDMPDLA